MMKIAYQRAVLLQTVADSPMSRRAKSKVCQGILRHRLYHMDQLLAVVQSGSIQKWSYVGEHCYREVKEWLAGNS